MDCSQAAIFSSSVNTYYSAEFFSYASQLALIAFEFFDKNEISEFKELILKWNVYLLVPGIILACLPVIFRDLFGMKNKLFTTLLPRRVAIAALLSANIRSSHPYLAIAASVFSILLPIIGKTHNLLQIIVSYSIGLLEYSLYLVIGDANNTIILLFSFLLPYISIIVQKPDQKSKMVEHQANMVRLMSFFWYDRLYRGFNIPHLNAIVALSITFLLHYISIMMVSHQFMIWKLDYLDEKNE